MRDDGNAYDDYITIVTPNDDDRMPPPSPLLLATMEDANVILQVNRSHLDRMADFFLATTTTTARHYHHHPDRGIGIVVVRVVSTRRSTPSKSCSLLLLRVEYADDDDDADDADNDDTDDDVVVMLDFLEGLTNRYDYVLRGLNKIYVMAGGDGRRGASTTMRGWIASSMPKGRDAAVVAGREDDDNDDEYNDDSCIERRLLALLRGLRCEYDDDDVKRSERSVVARVDVFPMKLQRRVVSNLSGLLDDESIPEEVLDVSPTNYTHALSVVQIDYDDDDDAAASSSSSIAAGKRKKTNDVERDDNRGGGRGGVRGTFLVGVVPLKLSAPAIRPASWSSSSSDDDDVICRSYRKLAEAFERHRGGERRRDDDDPILPSFPFFSDTYARAGPMTRPKNNHRDESPLLVAVDCGSAPGGWTKYLSERTACDVIYSIDPGEMDTRVSSLPKVHHLRTTSADALPLLRDALSSLGRREDEDAATEEDHAKVALWVGDMCTHEPTGQVDALLRARESGMIRHDAAFVLTIKCCNVGHGRARYDEFAEREATRLRDLAGAYGVEVMHLFSNRMSERTVIGYLK